MKYSGWPEPGELVVCKVTNVEDFGAFCDLVEYDDKRGLIHVSEVASGWVKYIRDHVREDQTVVCKVLDVDEDSQQIDLSLKDVSDRQTQEKIQEWKNEQKADKWLSMALEDDEEFTQAAEAMIQRYGTMYAAMEKAAMNGPKVLEEAGIDTEAAEKIQKVARENISVPFVEVTGYVHLRSTSPDGVDHVKEALKQVETNGEADSEIEIEYVSAPEYRITARAHDYKAAERLVRENAKRTIEKIKELGGTGEYHEESQKTGS